MAEGKALPRALTIHVLLFVVMVVSISTLDAKEDQIMLKRPARQAITIPGRWTDTFLTATKQVVPGSLRGLLVRENNDYNGEESSTDWLIGKMFAIRKGSNHAEKIRRTGSGTMEGDSQIDDIEETSGAEEFEESGEINGYNGDVYSGAWENA